MRAAALILAALILAALVATPALAEEPPQATASHASTPSVAEQIEDFLRTSPGARIEDDGVSGVTPQVTPGGARKVHGEVSVGVGTDGYRSLYMRSDMPIGETGAISVAIEDTRYGRSYAPAPIARFGPGPGLGTFRSSQRCDLEGLTPPRPLDVMGGPAGHCVRPPGR